MPRERMRMNSFFLLSPFCLFIYRGREGRKKNNGDSRVLPSRLIHPLDCDKCSWLIKTKKRKKGREKRRGKGEKEEHGARESLNARKTPRPIYIVHLDNTFFTAWFQNAVSSEKGFEEVKRGVYPGF